MFDQIDPQNMKRAFQLIEALFYGMPVEEYYDDHLDRIVASMSPEAVDFFAAVAATTALSVQLLTDEARAKFFAVGEACP